MCGRIGRSIAYSGQNELSCSIVADRARDARYMALEQSITSTDGPPQPMSEILNDPEIRRRRVLYRAAHRGTKEMDWLLGRFAEAEVESFDGADLNAFEQFLALPDPDIQEWLLNPNAALPNGSALDFVQRLKRFHDL